MRACDLKADLLRWCMRGMAVTVIAGAWLGSAAAASLAPGVQQKLGNATFEVVDLKPDPDPLTYEKPLPLELLPYRERTDKYRSVGTAFSIGHGRFVTAGHVLVIGAGSQYGPPALRDAAGKIYPLDKVIKYSASEDYAVFTVHNAPEVLPLETRDRPPLNEPVFAVGNALGEGVVIRDGLYTSDTPEEMDGRWKWLRFSAAASPGNSGGPLVDRTGKVVGVVLRKSPSENLNFAVAIGQVLDGSEEWAHFEGRAAFRLPISRITDTVETKDKSPLPQPVADFYAAMLHLLSTTMVRRQAEFLDKHGDHLFPHGDASLQLLNTLHVEAFPRLVVEEDGGRWGVSEGQTRKAQLEHNGWLETGSGKSDGLARFHVPDDVGVARIFSDSKLFMDLLLKGVVIQRQVGADAVRVTSMGAAREESWITDAYGRVWQLRAWAIPYNDTYALTLALPTPDGCAFFLTSASSTLHDPVETELKLLTNYIYVTYNGKLQQWRDYLALPNLLPKAMAGIKIQFDYGRGFAFQSSRFTLVVPQAVQKIDADSRLMLKFTYMPDGSATVWDVAGVFLADTEQLGRYVDFVRYPRPTPALPETMNNHWHVMTGGGHPYDSRASVVNGDSRIQALVNAKEVNAGRSNIGYSLMISVAGVQDERAMGRSLDLIERGITIREH